jgi:hypothetical protein
MVDEKNRLEMKRGSDANHHMQSTAIKGMQTVDSVDIDSKESVLPDIVDLN